MKRLTTDEFIKKALDVHGDKYDYSRVVYVKSQAKVVIICPEHGEFEQTPCNHLNGKGCKLCAIANSSAKRRITLEDFIRRARAEHGDKYDYSKVSIVNIDTPVEILCPEHGLFKQSPYLHMKGCGCPSCGHNKTIARTSLTTLRFIEKSRKIHGEEYDYSQVNYVNNHTKVCIICRTHGEFWQTPQTHIEGGGCPECYGTPKKSLEQFINESKRVHGDSFNYDEVDYKSARKKVRIICPIHGQFEQVPYNHLKGHGCPKCAGLFVGNTQEFIEKATMIHKDAYDYSSVEYVNTKTKVCIICKKHGEFWQAPNGHLAGHGCPECQGRNMNTEKFIEKARAIHGYKYDYSKTRYKRGKDEVIIICPEHGEFLQSPTKHLQGHGCPKCAGRNRTTEDFINDARKVHGNEYDYSKAKYLDATTPVCIICPKHGEFWQTPNAHINSGNCCPKCSSSRLENSMRKFLSDHSIVFVEQKTFSWLRLRNSLHLDFYLPEYHVAIECQGIQHFKPVEYFGGEEKFILEQYKDSLKKEKCEKHNIRLFYFSDLGIEYPYEVYEDLDMLLQKIEACKHEDKKIEPDLTAGL